MSILSSAHVHTQFCDGRSTAAQMAAAAWERGFVSLGFSSHAPQPFDPCFCMAREQEPLYRAQVRALQKEYAGRMTVYLGIERDYDASITPEGYDYYIASVHYLHGVADYTAVDGPAEKLAAYLRNECAGDGMTFARRYYARLREYVLSSRPPIIGHFDLIRKNNAALHFVDEESPAYRALAVETLEALAETGAFLEVNTGAISRGYLSTPYPAPFLLSAWRRLGGEVMVNSDCHDAEKIDGYYSQVEELLRSLGYDHAVRLGRLALWERFAL